MSFNLMKTIMACSICGADLSITDADSQLRCKSCGAEFTKGKYIWNFIPANIDWNSPIWQTWQQLQENGLISYQYDPEHNLSVIPRDDIRSFARFCNYHGLVLDVGCGPQPYPTYFVRDGEISYVGIDPLIDDAPGEYLRIKGLGEFLPFRSQTFDHVLFSTTLDHFVDPVTALRAAARVCKPGGEIDIWLGEKGADTPKPAESQEWYLHLEKPEFAEDLFHIKRLSKVEFVEVVQTAGLKIVQSETHDVDQYRANHFYRITTK